MSSVQGSGGQNVPNVGDTNEPLPILNPQENAAYEAMQTPVSTLGQLKSVLISHLGEQQGTKLYNQFLAAMVQTMLAPLRTAAQNAQQATQNMGQTDQ